MTRQTPIRNPKTDHLLTPENAVFVFIDYQPEQFDAVSSRPRDELILNVTALGMIALDFGAPSVLTTVGVELGANQATIPQLREALGKNVDEIDRTTLNSWEDAAFLAAVQNTGRKKIVMSGLWTEVCVAFPTLDALKEGFEVFPVVDAIGGVTLEAHQAAVSQMVQAGAQPVTTLGLACELQRDWARNGGHVLRRIYNWYFGELEGLARRAA